MRDFTFLCLRVSRILGRAVEAVQVGDVPICHGGGHGPALGLRGEKVEDGLKPGGVCIGRKLRQGHHGEIVCQGLETYALLQSAGCSGVSGIAGLALYLRMADTIAPDQRVVVVNTGRLDISST